MIPMRTSRPPLRSEPLVALPLTLQHWERADMVEVLRQELSAAPGNVLTGIMQRATRQGGHVDLHSLHIGLLHRHSSEDSRQLRLMLQFREIIGGCNCHDEPHGDNCQAILTVDVNPDNAMARLRLDA
jgi:hypothetical protein